MTRLQKAYEWQSARNFTYYIFYNKPLDIKQSSNPLLWVEALVAVAIAQLEMEHIASVAVGAYRAKIGTYAHALSLAHIDR